MEKITVSAPSTESAFVSYLYNALASPLARTGGSEELLLGDARTALRITVKRDADAVLSAVKRHIAEIVGVGYKYRFLNERLSVSLSKREKRLLCAALIAADFEGDKAYIHRKLGTAEEYSIDGFYHFRLGALREKWARIAAYVPENFASSDLKQFCDFLVGESRNKIYLKGNTVFGENFTPLRLSRLTGEEDTETEIMLSDAGFVYCLGEVEEGLGDFLQKFYAERAIFS